MTDQMDAILAKNAERVSEQRERKRLEDDAVNRRVKMVNAFEEISGLTRESFHRETRKDTVGINEFPENMPPPPDEYYEYKAAKVVKACKSLDGWEREFEEFSAETDSQRVAKEILRAGKDGDQDRVANLLVDLIPGSELYKQVCGEATRKIPHALADIDRAKWAPVKDEPEVTVEPRAGGGDENKKQPSKPTLIIDIERLTVTWKTRRLDVRSGLAVRWLKVLADNEGKWIPASALCDHDMALDGVRTDRLKKHIPKQVLKLIETSKRHGSRLVLPQR